jgi:hypothetical protein
MKTVNFKLTGYGQWKASTNYYGKEISMHFTDVSTVDLITSQNRGWKTVEKLVRFRIIEANK